MNVVTRYAIDDRTPSWGRSSICSTPRSARRTPANDRCEGGEATVVRPCKGLSASTLVRLASGLRRPTGESRIDHPDSTARHPCRLIPPSWHRPLSTPPAGPRVTLNDEESLKMSPIVSHVVHVVGDGQITSRQRGRSGCRALVDDVKDGRNPVTDNSG